MAHVDPAQYDGAATELVAHMEQGPYNVLYERPAIRELIGLVDGLRVLDVACGAGSLAHDLHQAGAKIVACDGSSEMVRLARERVSEDIELHHQDCSEPFTWANDASFDLVVMSLAYHYVNDRVAFLNEMKRVLQPNGAIVISTHHPTDDWRRLEGSYFTTGMNTDRFGAIAHDVVSWRMPLTAIMADFYRAGLLVQQLIEPQPSAALERSAPDVFAKLTECPAFILFRLVKAQA